jgi:regulator of sirC expression with transglutaminase-like and TPR domain
VNFSPESRVAGEWLRITRLAPDDMPLAEGALWIAAAEYPSLDVPEYLRRLEVLAETLRLRLRPDISVADKLRSLNHYLFGELGFSGATEDYDDPRNSFLNDVMDRRRGIPLSLSLIYLEVGRHIGLALHGVSFPGHFLVKCTLGNGVVVLDPFNRGLSLDADALSARLNAGGGEEGFEPAMLSYLLSAASHREMLMRMLRNLKGIYLSQSDWLRALAASERLVQIAPEIAGELRERAQIYVALECYRAALHDFRSYLRLAEDDADIAAVREEMARISPLVPSLN